MALNIRNTEAEKLVEVVVEMTGETKTEAVTKALKERMEGLKRLHSRKGLADELDEIALHCAVLPILDSRNDDEIVGYDKNGMPL